MIHSVDAAELAPEERLAEVCEVLARGYVRLLAKREEGLAGSGEAEASCEPPSEEAA